MSQVDERDASVPEGRCGFELRPEDIDSPTAVWNARDPACCCRPVWSEHKEQGRCIWHADVDEKPVEELIEARADSPERLDGAILRGVEAGGQISFDGCELRGANFDNADFVDGFFSTADLRLAEFPDAKLQRAVFRDANLNGAQFPEADLNGAQFSDANLRLAEFPDADLRETQFSDADLSSAEFSDANLRLAEFLHADLRRAEFPHADLSGAEFHDADLRRAEFSDADLRRAEFSDADFRLAKFRDADVFGANFRHANLQETVFTSTDCREATFTSALLYETAFEDSRLNSQTTFYESNTSRPVCVYEENELTTEKLPDDVHPLKAARWVYRRLETLHEENALSEEARNFHISKEEAERKLYKERGNRRRHVKTLMWALTNHGESVRRLLGWWAAIIIGAGLLFPFVGGIKDSNGGTYAINSLAELGTWAGWNDLLINIYFSIITFSTIGYGDLSPAAPGSRVLVAFESITGALLLALLIFVLGRRVAR